MDTTPVGLGFVSHGKPLKEDTRLLHGQYDYLFSPVLVADGSIWAIAKTGRSPTGRQMGFCLIHLAKDCQTLKARIPLPADWFARGQHVTASMWASGLALSPDGRTLALVVMDATPDSMKLVLVDTQTRGIRVLVSGRDLSSRRLAWSPDGSRIMFGTKRPARKSYNPPVICTIDLAGRSIQEYTAGSFPSYVSPTEAQFLLAKHEGLEIRRVNVATGTVRVVTELPGMWDLDMGACGQSPDGQYIMLVKREMGHGLGHSYRIYVCEVSSGKCWPVTASKYRPCHGFSWRENMP
jgi:hypothetical protein